MSSSSTIYTDFVLNDKLISPKNGHTCRRLTRQNIKQFGFNSIDDLREQYPDFPLYCPETLEQLSLTSKTTTQPMEAKAKRIEEYSHNPSRCIQCDCILEYKRKRNKFCNKSCSATHNNQRRAIDKNIIPKHFKSHIIPCQKVLGIVVVTLDDFQKTKDIFQELILKGLSGQQIADKFGIINSNFVSVLAKVFKMKMLSMKDRPRIYNENFNPDRDKKAEYKRNCSFDFNPYMYPDMVGHSLLLENGIYHPINNPNGVCRDHIISKEYGWANNIDPAVMSHPANCQFLSNIDNIFKGTRSDMSIEELMALINGNVVTTRTVQKRVARSEEHRRKISMAGKGTIFVTNGTINKRISKADHIPEGFWRGSTRRNKLVNAVC